MNIQFMCKKHREKLEENPQSAMIVWIRLINLARHQTGCDQWNNAIKSYGNALDTAAIIFEKNPQSAAINRYIRTGVELIYTLRQCGEDCNTTTTVVKTIKKIVEKNLYPANVDLLIKPLKDVCNAPLDKVHHWINTLIIEDEMRYK